jgi:hypothetical protein
MRELTPSPLEAIHYQSMQTISYIATQRSSGNPMKLSILIGRGVCLSLVSFCGSSHAETLPPLESVERVQNVAGSSKVISLSRAQRISSLRTVLLSKWSPSLENPEDYQQHIKQGLEIVNAIGELGDLKAIEVVDDLIDRIDIDAFLRRVGKMRMNTERFHPPLSTFAMQGPSALPKLIDRIAGQESEAPVDYKSATPLDFNGLLCINAIQLTLPANERVGLNANFELYAREYISRAERLRLLAGLSPEMASREEKVSYPSGLHNAVRRVSIPIGEGEKQTEIDQFARILNAEYVLLDTGASEETKVVNALSELGKMRSVRSVPLIAGKLDPEWDPKLSDSDSAPPFATIPTGLRTDSIATASYSALHDIGEEGLPYLLDEMVTTGRSGRIRSKGMEIVSDLVKDQEQRKQLLLRQAQFNAWKAQRLRAHIKSHA